MLLIAALTILIAFAFTFTNGFQDAATVAATFIASGSATPRQGIIMVAGMNFLGAILGGSAVAFTLSGLLTIASGPLLLEVLLAALLAAAAWNVGAWYLGLPSSSTHALIGGLMGAGIMAAGIGSIYWGVADLLSPPHEITGMVKVLLFFVLSIVLGLVGGYLMRRCTWVLFRNAKRTINRSIIRINWLAAAGMAFFNGSNDAQKQLGIIALVLFAAGESAVFAVPLWARGVCALLLTMGTLGGGWRIMKTIGNRIFSLKPVHSMDSQISSGVTLGLSTLAGAPVSSTHIITMSVIGVGAAENPRNVRWRVGEELILSMFVTIPSTMLLSGALLVLVQHI
ncbi:inorganic phosphate transporter [Methanogenium sp. S4BF]|uniref:inorganic phosphate transporter n=1 Tax=Methanogenium sp. S4BF TaxID=1789226 RepID=UPI0024163175|nr:inorganic phosphate transporter [Methanogenium sp. S4BF]WFN34554.1 inorganic phosphate transporter [Methanogenium sp. S4BF]